MKNVTITEINAEDDVKFDQTIDSDSVVAMAGGLAINGSVRDSALNTGINKGIMAGDDVDLDNSVVGDDNVQFNDSEVGAFAQGGDAMNIDGENVNMGSGDLIDVETGKGDAQVVNGHGNQLFGDIDVDSSGSDGPANFVFGNDNSAKAMEDNSVNIDDSGNVDKSIDDSYNKSYEDSYNKSYEDNDTTTKTVTDSYNEHSEDNDLTKFSWDKEYTDKSVTEDNDTYELEASWTKFDVDMHHSDDNDVSYEA
ncbi:MAG: hypothetical protein ACKV2O_10625 [Acidimicrobiales bacterium]